MDIPADFTCDGREVSPPLSWSGAPRGTRSLALIVDDPDAPDLGFVGDVESIDTSLVELLLSRDFAELCAEILVASGFTVYFLDGYRSTPELSVAVPRRSVTALK